MGSSMFSMYFRVGMKPSSLDNFHRCVDISSEGIPRCLCRVGHKSMIEDMAITAHYKIQRFFPPSTQNLDLLTIPQTCIHSHYILA